MHSNEAAIVELAVPAKPSETETLICAHNAYQLFDVAVVIDFPTSMGGEIV